LTVRPWQSLPSPLNKRIAKNWPPTHRPYILYHESLSIPFLAIKMTAVASDGSLPGLIEFHPPEQAGQYRSHGRGAWTADLSPPMDSGRDRCGATKPIRNRPRRSGGSRVANGPEMAVAFLGRAAAATCTPLNPAFRAGEFDFYLSTSALRRWWLLLVPIHGQSP
jgi:hypothetical protein